MIGHNLDLTALLPQRDTCTDTDGTRHEFRSPQDFGAIERARTLQLTAQIREAEAAFEQSPQDVAAATKLESLMRELVRLLLPTMPHHRIDALPYQQVFSIIRWWNGQRVNGGGSESGLGESKASQPEGVSPG